MAFHDITDRIVAILEAERTRLVSGLRDSTIAIESQYPVDHFANQVLFVWREASGELEYGNITGAGTGSSAGGEIMGLGQWAVSAHVRYTGNESVAADQLSKLAWNIITVLAGYTKDASNTYLSLMVGNTMPDYSLGTTGGTGWYIGERFPLRVRWDLTL